MNASVIVPARNALPTLQRTLAALASQDFDGDYEVIVVDDGSSDATIELARRAPGPVTVVSQPVSGQAAARNLGVARSRGALLAFCDADVFPTEGWLRSGVDALARADMVQGKVLPDPLVEVGPFDRTIWITSESGLWEAANLFVTRELFERIGGFEDGIRPPRGKPLAEDVLFGQAARKIGACLDFCPGALAYHAVVEREWRTYVGERWRRRYFPLIARQAPGLREHFLYRRWFLDTRSARLDLAVAAAIASYAAGSTVPLIATAPYLRVLRTHSSRGRPTGSSPFAVGLVDLAADLIGLAALMHGSLRYRALVL